MNGLDRMIAAVAPQWGVRRAAARNLLEMHDTASRAYAAAGRGRRNKGWSGRSTSANSEIGSSLRELRNRSREFVRDSWAGQRILDVITAHTVGTGIMTIPNTGGDRLDNQIKLAFEEWSGVADIEGHLNWHAQQALAVRSMVEGGDSVIRYIPIRMQDANGTIPFRLQGLEGDQIDTSRDLWRMQKDRNIRLGVQLGEWGVREGLWLHKDHPGEQSISHAAGSSLVRWSDLSHVYRPLRFGQVRGIPWFSPILLNAREEQDLLEATLVKARTEACFAAFIRNGSGGTSPLSKQTSEDKDGKKLTRIEPGMITHIGDSEIDFANPSTQTAVSDVHLINMQAMAAGAGITYDQLTGDLRQANYSSLRAGKIEFRRLVEQIQGIVLVPSLIAPVSRRVVDMGAMSGKIRRSREAPRLEYIMPAVEPIDPKKDLEADILAVRSGRCSPQDFISAWGRDWRDVVADTASFFEHLDKQNDGDGVALDIDGRRPMKGNGNGKPDGKPDQNSE